MLSVTCKPYKLGVVMLNVTCKPYKLGAVILSVVMVIVVAPNNPLVRSKSAVTSWASGVAAVWRTGTRL